MRIAYIVPYQGQTLLQRRPIIRNRSMSNSIKVELIATSLRGSSHDVDIISQGEVVESSCSFYPSFSDPARFHPEIPIHYASALAVRRLNGIWSNARTLHLFKKRHRDRPYDLVIIFNMKGPQVACANYSIHHLGVPVLLEYEDDSFSSVHGEALNTYVGRSHAVAAHRLLRAVAGCMAVSPYLLSQLPAEIPRLLLRGVVGQDVVEASRSSQKRNIVLFSGTHIPANGVAELIEAWRSVCLANWELHITGYGQMTESLRQMAREVPGVVFHGLVDRSELVRLVCTAKICINPFVKTPAPGSVFAFKIVEYLAAGAHVISTPMGPLEKEIEAGVSYMPDNSAATIAATVKEVIESRRYELRAMDATQQLYGPKAVTASLDRLVRTVVKRTPKVPLQLSNLAFSRRRNRPGAAW